MTETRVISEEMFTVDLYNFQKLFKLTISEVTGIFLQIDLTAEVFVGIFQGFLNNCKWL